MDILMTCFTFVIFLFSLKNMKALPFPTGIILIIFISQVMFILVHDNYVVNEFYGLVNLGGLKENYEFMHFLYGFMALFFYITMLSFGGKSGNLINTDVSLLHAKRGATQAACSFIIIFCIIHLILFIYINDISKIWYHRTYLSPIEDEDVVDYIGGVIPSIINKLYHFSYIFATIGFFVSKEIRYTAGKYILGVLSFTYFIYIFSVHSRVAIFFPFFAIMFTILGNRPFKKVKITAYAFLLFFVWICALVGRGYPGQGLGAIPETIGEFFSADLSDTGTKVALNLTEGIFETAEGIQQRHSYSTTYEILAFSPLPSSIDGYEAVQNFDQVRLHPFVPTPGVAEIVMFSPVFWGVMLALYAVTVKIHMSVKQKSGILFLTCNFLIMISIYHMMAYPVRNALHLLWVAIFICIVSKIVISRQRGYGKLNIKQA